MKTEYSTDIYVRLSREDGDKPESDSISNQKNLILDFLKSRPELRLHQIRVDDGFSGVNFERPSFLEMMDDIKAGKVDCVVVKDLSRFGRNWLEVGKYVQQIFPFLGVRFIAVNENYDSLGSDTGTSQLVLPIRNLINDTYAGDISMKTRSNFAAKRKLGEFVGAFAAYGYKKDPSNRHKLVIDEDAAVVVRDIFAMKKRGLNLTAIADKLNSLDIPSPMEHKKLNGEKYATSFKCGDKAKWTPVAVNRILSNELYIGNLVQGKRGSVNYKDKNMRLLPEEEWVRADNTHEPIVSRDDFELVQKLKNYDTRTASNSEGVHLFSGLLFCGDCKQNMVRHPVASKGRQYNYYICSSHKKDAELCTTHSVSEDTLTNVVLEVLRQHINQIVELDELLSFLGELPHKSGHRQELTHLIEQHRQVIIDIEAKKRSLYDDLKDGFLSKEDYRSINKTYTREMADENTAIRKYEDELRKLEDPSNQYKWIERIKSLGKLERLDRELLVTLVDKIYIYEDKRIEIKLNFSDEYAEIMKYISAIEADGETEAI